MYQDDLDAASQRARTPTETSAVALPSEAFNVPDSILGAPASEAAVPDPLPLNLVFPEPEDLGGIQLPPEPEDIEVVTLEEGNTDDIDEQLGGQDPEDFLRGVKVEPGEFEDGEIPEDSEEPIAGPSAPPPAPRPEDYDFTTEEGRKAFIMAQIKSEPKSPSRAETPEAEADDPMEGDGIVFLGSFKGWNFVVWIIFVMLKF